MKLSLITAAVIEELNKKKIYTRDLTGDSMVLKGKKKWLTKQNITKNINVQ